MVCAACGVYSIRHLKSGRAYVGSSINIQRRWKDHRGYLQRGNHPNPKLQALWNKHGADAFVWEVLYYCPEEEVRGLEQRVIYEVRPALNLCLVVGLEGAAGRVWSQAERRRNRLSQPTRTVLTDGDRVFHSYREAATALGVQHTTVMRAVRRGKALSSGTRLREVA